MPRALNGAVNDAAAKTLMYPLSELDDGEPDAVPPVPPHAASNMAETNKTKRLRIDPLAQPRGSSITTLVAFTDATATTPAFSPSSSADSRVISDTIRYGPACISTWAATPSLMTRVMMPTKRLRADSLAAAGGSWRGSAAMYRARAAPSI